MSHLYCLDKWGMPMPSMLIPTQDPGYRMAWVGEMLPTQGAQVWYESIRRWLDIPGGIIYTEQPLDPRLHGRIVRVPL